MENEIWIEKFETTELQNPVAIVGSPGLRSIGKLVVDQLINDTDSQLLAELYSTHLPIIYQTKPSYFSHFSLPGVGGVKVNQGQIDLPKVQFYACSYPPIILVRGYHANFDGQYDVASKVVNFLKENEVTQIIVTAGYGSKTHKICCAATNPEILLKMKETFKIDVEYFGPFYGFSGLVFGLANSKNIDALCLFSGTEPNLENPESPDPESSQLILEILNQILNLNS
jgi:proteasome assembly chaperone (PAC2) family protein